MSAVKSAVKNTLRRLVIRLYARRVEDRLDTARAPKHIGVILDGNRRWAKAAGAPTRRGHEAGAAKIRELLGWCAETDVEVVTLWMLSTDNLNREPDELAQLLTVVENAVRDLAADGRWRVHHVGALDVLPERTRRVLREAEETARAAPASSSTSPSGTAAGRRSPTPSARCSPSAPPRAARWSRSRRPSAWRTSPSTSTHAASPTPTS